jgi:hydrogenase nickel incorporation protein HypA/HybF
MHELSVTQNILEIALRHAEQAGAQRILSLNLAIGELTSIVDDSVQFYWDIIAKDTIAEGSALHFKRLPAELLCLDCNNRYSPADDLFTCPACQSAHLQIVAGRDFFLESIDVT